MDEKTENVLFLHLRNLIDLSQWYAEEEGFYYCNSCNAMSARRNEIIHADDCPLVEICELLGWPIPTR